MANVKGAPRQSWNFGNFGTRHDGTKWRLVRIKNADGTNADGSKVLASNKSATPLVNLARELSRVEPGEPGDSPPTSLACWRCRRRRPARARDPRPPRR